MKKLLVLFSILTIFVPSFAFAAPFDFLYNYNDALNAPTPGVLTPPTVSDGDYYFLSFRGVNGTGEYKFVYPAAGILMSGGNMIVNTNTIETPDGTLANTITRLDGSLNTLSSSLSAIAPPLNIASFMSNNASTTLFVASSTQNGFLSATDKAKLDTLATPTAGTSTRSIVTGTGATGFQVSSTRPTNNCYSVTIVSGSALLNPVYGYVAFEIAPTNSAISGAWTEIGRTGGGDTIGLLHTGTATGQLCGFVPAGYYSKLRSVNVAGTATYSYNSGQEVIW